MTAWLVWRAWGACSRTGPVETVCRQQRRHRDESTAERSNADSARTLTNCRELVPMLRSRWMRHDSGQSCATVRKGKKGRWQVRLLFGENKGKRLTGVVPGTEDRSSTGKGGRGSDMSRVTFLDFPGKARRRSQPIAVPNWKVGPIKHARNEGAPARAVSTTVHSSLSVRALPFTDPHAQGAHMCTL